ncbi:LacI family DNA-binding transcriptional regulator [uncultured Cohaesibacter sp.]|uniref:LacI family DNA-binding transcriptional regulator n=1 Tax=uncultured Cohaesibacter sp. TaxID=1002546 RepID=UPI00292EC956|nr:LacI family DNA-binding transcriptional regulator [uncultured Cohaesibacter sp.]
MKPPKQFSKVTMRDVAAAAGCSTMTVSRALQKDGRVSEKTRKHILKTVRQLGYVPDLTAGSLSSKRSGFIALLLPSLNNQHLAEMVHALTDELAEADLQLLIGHTNYLAQKEEALIGMMLRRRPEALVICYDGHTERAADMLKTVSVPVIELWEDPEDPIQHTVGFSNFKAARDMTLALIERGYRKLSFLGESSDDGTRAGARRRGFQAAMVEAGLEGHRVVQHDVMPISIEGAKQACQTILDDYPETDCIFCVSDPAAFGALSLLQEKGIAVPDDIGLCGFGNFEISRFTHPPTSTVGVDASTVGRKAAELILRILAMDEGEEDDQHLSEHIRLRPELMFRASVKETV